MWESELSFCKVVSLDDILISPCLMIFFSCIGLQSVCELTTLRLTSTVEIFS